MISSCGIIKSHRIEIFNKSPDAIDELIIHTDKHALSHKIGKNQSWYGYISIERSGPVKISWKYKETVFKTDSCYLTEGSRSDSRITIDGGTVKVLCL
jgi:hypothetical protein